MNLLNKYEELSAAITEFQRKAGMIPRSDIAKEHAQMKKKIREAYANRMISGAQAGRLLRELA